MHYVMAHVILSCVLGAIISGLTLVFFVGRGSQLSVADLLLGCAFGCACWSAIGCAIGIGKWYLMEDLYRRSLRASGDTASEDDDRA